jgi:putative membrane protein
MRITPLDEFIYFVVPMPNLPQRIAAGDLAPAIRLGVASLAAGAVSAAAISYRVEPDR